MNIQGGSMLERRPASRREGFGRWFKILIPVILPALYVLVLANTYVYINQKITEADREMLRLRNQLAGVEREIDSYRLQYERYSAWPHIRDSIRRFNLPLRQATTAQCRPLAMIPPSLAPSIRITFRETVTPPSAAVKTPAAVVRTAPVVRRPAPAAVVRTAPRPPAVQPVRRSRSYSPQRYSRN